MYLTLSPFFYYLGNCNYINDYLAIELNGKPSLFEDSHIVKGLIKEYILNNSHGVDIEKLDRYVEYIFKHLTN